MLRWLILLVLLANSLLFLWYAQQYRFSEAIRQPDIRPSKLRLASELGEGQALKLRAKLCVKFYPLTAYDESQRLVDFLRPYQIDASVEKEPPQVIGQGVFVPMPADNLSRVTLLDELALLGWVPEVREGSLFLGVYENQLEIDSLLTQLSTSLASRIRVKPHLSENELYSVVFSHLQGFEIDQELIDLVAKSWPGVGIEKKRCLGVATHKIDQ